MSVAQTIAKQINGMDPMAFFAWGTSELTAFSESEDDLGALRFKVRNCRNFRGTAFIKVTLDFSDTYTVSLYKHKNITKSIKAKMLEGDWKYDEKDFINEISTEKDVYFDQLVTVIDKIVGEK